MNLTPIRQGEFHHTIKNNYIMLNYKYKIRKDLIKELQELQIEYNSLKTSYDKDITERRQEEEMLTREQYLMNALMNNLPDHIYFKDLESRYIKINKSHALSFGINDPDQTIGKTDFDFYPNELASQYFADEQTIVQTGQPISKEEIKTWANRPDTWVLTIKLPLVNQEGIIIGTFGISRDITERKQAEQKLIMANKELEAFSYSVSHDLRAPLRHIGGFVDLLINNNSSQLDEAGLRYLNIISESSHEMGNLIDALLTFSRLSRTELQRTEINSKSMVPRVIKTFSDELAGRNVEINISELPDAKGDEGLINQVWVNLISNALKYSRNKEKAVIDIGGKIENDKTIFYIKDNGAGFDMKYSAKLFGVFQRLHKARDFEGIGIGLANVNRIVMRHGGKCWAESEIGNGATFFFSIPNN